MSTHELRRQALRRMRSLSPERLKVAADFLAYLQERESNEATEELLRIPGFPAAFERMRRGAGKAKLTNWRRARKDV